MRAANKVKLLVAPIMIRYSAPRADMPGARMVRAIIFDFNGVIADDETSHVTCFRQALAEVGLSLTAEEYYGAYLGMDERTCAAHLLTARDGAASETILERIASRKAELFRLYTAARPPELFPGVVEFVKAARSHCRLAIASGGRRHQIDHALAGTLIEGDFELIVAAEDCAIGKPDPAIYLLTLSRLNRASGAEGPLAAGDCLVIEDSLAGIRSAKAAGMTVLALATTYPPERLSEADLVMPLLQSVTPEIVISRLAQIRH